MGSIQALPGLHRAPQVKLLLLHFKAKESLGASGSSQKSKTWFQSFIGIYTGIPNFVGLYSRGFRDVMPSDCCDSDLL